MSGPQHDSADRLMRRTDRRLFWVGMFANGLGALVLFLFISLLTPRTIEADDYEPLLLRNGVVFVVYMAITLPLGRRWVRRRYWARLAPWLRGEREVSEADRALVLRYPLYFAKVAASFWGLAAIVFAPINASASGAAALTIGVTVILGGMTACALQYLLVERALRPITAKALAGGPPPRLRSPGVAGRLTMTWTLATGVPLVGIVAFAVADLAGAELDEGQLVAATLFLAAVAVSVGLLAMLVAARSVGDPLSAVGQALERVERGDLETRVAVDDGSEVGVLQAGFNRMTAGLAERERLRDLFGRHVGRDVARAAADGEVALGGEVRDVAALFVDVVGSTSLAARRPPTEVVALLNDFFCIVVEAAEHHRGWVNKFEGDAALCVFGAPTAQEDPAGDALGAAREIRDRLAAELPSVDVGIGVSAGPAVAGNVGAEERFEYTVIGDPVNEAARLCELAKDRPERVLAAAAAVSDAGSEEARRWSLGEAVTLRGRDSATRLATALRS